MAQDLSRAIKEACLSIALPFADECPLHPGQPRFATGHNLYHRETVTPPTSETTDLEATGEAEGLAGDGL